MLGRNGEPIFKSYNRKNIFLILQKVPGIDFIELRNLRKTEYYSEVLTKIKGLDTLYSKKIISLKKVQNIFDCKSEELLDLVKGYLGISTYINGLILAYMNSEYLTLYYPFLK